jgi:hypothetical protein
MAVARRDNWGGRVYLYIAKTIAFSKEIRRAEHEYMNMPPPIIGLATVLFYITLAVTLGK